MDKNIALTLGKLLVAVAWADGVLQEEEIEVLKDLIYSLPDLSRDDWASIEIYMQSPVTGKECQMLMDRFRSLIRTEEEKQFAIRALQSVLHAGGEVSREELAMFHVIREEIESASSGLASKLGDFFKGARAHRQNTISRIPRRERNLDDFIENPVFYHAFNKLTSSGVPVHMNRAELEKLCVAGALMASIAQADGEVDAAETIGIKDAFKRHWSIGEEAAQIVADIAVSQEIAGLDILRLCRKLYDQTNEEERLSFLRILCDIVRADNVVKPDELERVRGIGVHLKLPSSTVLRELPELGKIAPA